MPKKKRLPYGGPNDGWYKWWEHPTARERGINNRPSDSLPPVQDWFFSGGDSGLFEADMLPGRGIYDSGGALDLTGLDMRPNTTFYPRRASRFFGEHEGVGFNPREHHALALPPMDDPGARAFEQAAYNTFVERQSAFESWTSGIAGGHDPFQGMGPLVDVARERLWKYYSGVPQNPIDAGMLAGRGIPEHTPEQAAAFHSLMGMTHMTGTDPQGQPILAYEGQWDWQNPMPTMWEAAPNATLTEQMQEHIAMRAMDYPSAFPGVNPEDKIGIAHMGALDAMSGMTLQGVSNFMDAYDQGRGYSYLNRVIEGGMNRALTGENKSSWEIEQAEVFTGVDQGLNMSLANQQFAGPSMLDDMAAFQAGGPLRQLGRSLDPGQRETLRQALETEFGEPLGSGYTVGQMRALDERLQSTSFGDLPEHLQAFKQSKHLEGFARKMHRQLSGRIDIPLEARQAASAIQNELDRLPSVSDANPFQERDELREPNPLEVRPSYEEFQRVVAARKKHVSERQEAFRSARDFSRSGAESIMRAAGLSDEQIAQQFQAQENTPAGQSLGYRRRWSASYEEPPPTNYTDDDVPPDEMDAEPEYAPRRLTGAERASLRAQARTRAVIRAGSVEEATDLAREHAQARQRGWSQLSGMERQERLDDLGVRGWGTNRARSMGNWASTPMAELSERQTENFRGGHSIAARGQSLALRSLTESVEAGGFEGMGSAENQLVELRNRVMRSISSSIMEEMDRANQQADPVEATKLVNEVQNAAVSAFRNTFGEIAENAGLDPDSFTMGAAGGMGAEALNLNARRHGDTIQALWQDDQQFRASVIESGGIEETMRRGGTFDMGDGGRVVIRGDEGWTPDGPGGGPGGRGRGGYGGAYGPIRAWYTMRAFSGALGMAYGNSLQNIAGAEEFGMSMQGLGVDNGIVGTMTAVRNRQAFAGIASQQQMGFVHRTLNERFGSIGAQRYLQAGQTALGLGASGYMASAMLAMSGAGAMPALGPIGLSLGAAYMGVTVAGDISGASGPGGFESGVKGIQQGVAGLQGIGLAGAQELGEVFGVDLGVYGSGLWKSIETASRPLPEVDSKYTELLDFYREAGLDGADVNQLAGVHSSLAQIYGPGTVGPSNFVESGFAPRIIEQQARAAGMPAQDLLAQSYSHAQRVAPHGPEQLSAMLNYALLSPQRRTEVDTFAALTGDVRGTLMQGGLPLDKAWGEVEAVFQGSILPEQVPAAMDAAQMTAIARGYGIDVNLESAWGTLGGRSAAERAAGLRVAEATSAMMYGNENAALNVEYMTKDALGYGPQAALGFAQMAQLNTQYSKQQWFTPEQMDAFGQTTDAGRQNIMAAVSTGWSKGQDTWNWLDFGDLASLTDTQQSAYTNLLGMATSSTLPVMSTMLLDRLGGLEGTQLSQFSDFTSMAYGSGMDPLESISIGSVASRLDPMQASRYGDIATTAMNLGTEYGDAWRLANRYAGADSRTQMDVVGAMRGDLMSAAAMADRGWDMPRLRDPNTGLNLYPTLPGGQFGGETLTQQDVWGLEDQGHQLQYGDQQFRMAMSQERHAQNTAMAYGGSFYNAMTGGMTNVQYGQFQISDALWDISVRQQRDNFDYQQRQQSLSMNYQRDQMNTNYEQQVTRWEWGVQDWEHGENVNQLQFAWQMEDYGEGIRRARGYQRRQLMKQRDRAVISESMRRGHSEDQRERMDQEREWLDERHDKQREYFEENARLQQDRLEKDRRYFEERLVWQNRERDLSRMSAQLELNRQTRELSHNQQMMVQQELLYQKMTELERTRETFIANFEAGLRNLDTRIDEILGGIGGGTSGGGAVGVGTAVGGFFDNITGALPRGSAVLPSRGVSPLSSPAPQMDNAPILERIANILEQIRQNGGSVNLNLVKQQIASAVDNGGQFYNETYQVH